MKSRRFIALPFDALNHRLFAFASSAKRPNVSFGSARPNHIFIPVGLFSLSSVIGGSHNPNIILAARQPLRSAIAAGDREIAPRIGFFRALPRQLNWTTAKSCGPDAPTLASSSRS
jgi:hypothetical protein